MKKTYAIITPSYVKDFERCKLLVESKRKFLKDNVVQYIVIDKSDIKLFTKYTALVDYKTTFSFKE
jgi:hypothetical protein